MPKPASSASMESYFAALEEAASRAYKVAERARARGFDPVTHVEVPRADDLASRVEKLLRIDGLAPRIRQLSETNDRENVSILIAKEIAREVVERTRDREKALDTAVRVGLAVLTEGILVAPLDGITEVKLRSEPAGEHVAVFYSSPIASSGGTALAMSVLIADLVRRDLGIGKFAPTDGEVQRFKEELPLYRQEVALQYLPSSEEIEVAVRGCPVCIDGEGTEDAEVSGHRDLPRIETNQLRGGACLVVANGLCHKAAKLLKHVERLKIDGWEFLHEILRMQSKTGQEDRTQPNEKYLKDQLAGRPVLSEASRPGGFRLRYGRTRASGLAALGIHPAAMALLRFVAVGTQLKIERPGKACATTPCDSIDGPWVLLNDGELLQLVSAEHAEALAKEVREIVDLGDILVPFGEFAENNHPLMPAAWVEEWWEREIEKSGITDAGGEEARSLVARAPRDSRAAVLLARHGTPLHPRFTYLWHDLDSRRILELRRGIVDTGRVESEALVLQDGGGGKRALVELCVPHRGNQTLRVPEHWALLEQLGLNVEGGRVVEARPVTAGAADLAPLDLVRSLSSLDIRPRAPTRIGTRMGRPEKAKERKMKPAIHILFPMQEGPRTQRDLEGVIESPSIRVEAMPRRCVEHGHLTAVPKCVCGSWSEPAGPAKMLDIDLAAMIEKARERLGEEFVARAAEKVKGVQGLTSRDKVPESLEKGLLRAAHDVFVFKDGTIRFDATDVPLTHFIPREVGLGVDRARELGYLLDCEGKPLERDDQLLELRVQDVVAPRSCLEYLVKVARFVDDLLVKVYGLEAFYNIRRPEELIGQLVVGLAPHTSGGLLARLIGSVPGKVCYAHPFFHAGKRRNSDGDEDSLMLLLDCLLNFSRSYLPKNRGGNMDAPLLLATRIDPDEIDKEAHNIDVVRKYPLELYVLAARKATPKEAGKLVERVADRLGTAGQYEGLWFTHPTSSLVAGRTESVYATIETMKGKLDAQLELYRKLRAIDSRKMIASMLSYHFLRDMQGCLSRFARQEFRCQLCSTKYRRVPLTGTCSVRDCGGKVVLTVGRGFVVKYLDEARHIVRDWKLEGYVAQRVELIGEYVRSTFREDGAKRTLEQFAE